MREKEMANKRGRECGREAGRESERVRERERQRELALCHTLSQLQLQNLMGRN